MSNDDLYTFRWHVQNGKPVPNGPVLDAGLDILRPVLGPEPGYQDPPAPDIPIDADLDANDGPPLVPVTPEAEKAKDVSWLVPGSKFPIVGRQFSRAEFLSYVQAQTKLSWEPIGVTIHGTSAPSLSQRPDGFVTQHMHYLRDYYLSLGWSRGPHLFVDDLGIWVFNPLTLRGTHSPSYNNTRFGVEMLGDYDKSDDPTSGRGRKVIENAQYAAAVLLKYFKLGSQYLNFHRHDALTTHRTCPGGKIDFPRFESEMIAIYNQLP